MTIHDIKEGISRIGIGGNWVTCLIGEDGRTFVQRAELNAINVHLVIIEDGPEPPIEPGMSESDKKVFSEANLLEPDGTWSLRGMAEAIIRLSVARIWVGPDKTPFAKD